MNTNHHHRIIRRMLLAAILSSLGTVSCNAQFTFDCGSNGTWNGNGIMNITENTTLEMPANGIFHCTTITVAPGATLKFAPNALNTPVYLLATGDVTISGTIDVSGSAGTGLAGGAGGPGGFAGGNPGNGGLPDGCGHGPGAAPSGGAASYGTRPSGFALAGAVYGSPVLVPLVGGSGGSGSGGMGGGGGGGAILIASNTEIEVIGGVAAIGPQRYYLGEAGLGSGGAIRLVAPVVAGNGNLNASGSLDIGYNFSGGAGRIRIDCMDRRSLALNCVPSSVATIGANMMSFPTILPRLDITQVAGTNITVGTSAPVSFMLPENSSPNQTVTVQASNFGAVVPIRVVLTPDNGPSSTYDAEINNTTINPASSTVNVVVPVNVQVHVEAWTR